MTDDLRRALQELADDAPTRLTRPVRTASPHRTQLAVAGAVLACLAVLAVLLLPGQGEALRQRVDVAAPSASPAPLPSVTPSETCEFRQAAHRIDRLGAVPEEDPEAAAVRFARDVEGAPTTGWTLVSETMNSAVLLSGDWRVTAVYEQDAPRGWVGVVAGRCGTQPEVSPSPAAVSPSPSPAPPPPPSPSPSPAITPPGPGLEVTLALTPARPQAGQRVRVHVQVRDTDGYESGGSLDFGNGSGAGLPVASSACAPYEGPYVVQPSDQGFDYATTYDAAGSYTVTATVSTGGGCQDTPRESRTAVARVVVGEAPSGQRVVLENDTSAAVTAYCADCGSDGLPLAPSAEASFGKDRSGQVEFRRADGTSTCVVFGGNEASPAPELHVRVSEAGSCPGGTAGTPQP